MFHLLQVTCLSRNTVLRRKETVPKISNARRRFISYHSHSYCPIFIYIVQFDINSIFPCINANHFCSSQYMHVFHTIMSSNILVSNNVSILNPMKVQGYSACLIWWLCVCYFCNWVSLNTFIGFPLIGAKHIQISN